MINSSQGRSKHTGSTGPRAGSGEGHSGQQCFFVRTNGAHPTSGGGTIALAHSVEFYDRVGIQPTQLHPATPATLLRHLLPPSATPATSCTYRSKLPTPATPLLFRRSLLGCAASHSYRSRVCSSAIAVATWTVAHTSALRVPLSRSHLRICKAASVSVFSNSRSMERVPSNSAAL